MSNEAWARILRGEIDEGLRDLQQGVATSERGVVDLGVAFLWTKRYDEAATHFLTALKQNPKEASPEIFYSLAGAAQWCLGRHDDARSIWANGLSFERMNWPGEMELLLLKYAAEALSGDLEQTREAAAELRDFISDRGSSVWPGELLEFVAGWKDEATVRADFAGDFWRSWPAEFYFGVKALAAGDQTKGRTLLVTFTKEVSRSMNDLPRFVDMLWNAEYFLARHALESRC